MAVRVPVAKVGSSHNPLATTDFFSLRRNLRESSTATTLTADDDVVIHTGAAVNYTLLTAAVATLGKVVTILNQGTGTVTLVNGPVRTSRTATVTSIAAGSSLTFISTGTQYRRLL